MALIQDGEWVATITIADRDKDKSTLNLRLLDTLDRDAAFASLNAIATAVDAISDGVVVGVTLSQRWYNDAYNPATVPEASDVQRKGVFQFQTAAREISTYEVPSIDNTLVIDGTSTINTTAAAVIAFQNVMLNTTLGAGNSPVNNAGGDYTAVAGAPYKRHRGSAKG